MVKIVNFIKKIGFCFYVLVLVLIIYVIGIIMICVVMMYDDISVVFLF